MDSAKAMAGMTEALHTSSRKRRAEGVQQFRFFSQLLALGVNVWIGIQFYLFVKYIGAGGQGGSIARPPGVEGWLPIGALVSVKHFLSTGIINSVHPAGFVIFVVILLSALLFKKGFCSWICPVGFISEMLGNISDKLFGRKVKPPRWLDYPLRSLKYIILLFFIYAILISMNATATESFLYSNYNMVADILMLRFFTEISMFALGVISLLFVLSLVVRGFWCRYLCPYGALLGVAGLLSPTRIRRSASSCIDCSACARACPAFIKVDKVTEVISDECIGCMACVDSCPVQQTLEVKMARKKWGASTLKWAALLVLCFWGPLLIAKFWGPWQNSITVDQYVRFMPGILSGRYGHP